MDDLFQELFPAIKRMASRFKAEIHNRVSVEDLAQTAALVAWDGILKAAQRDRSAVTGYCLTKAKWSMIDAFRRELSQADWYPLPDRWEDHPQVGRTESAEACASRRQLLEKASQVAEQLPHDQREVLRRLYVDEEGQAEAGAAMGVTQSRVSQIHSKAILALRSALA